MHMDIVVEQTPGEVKTDLVKKKKKNPPDLENPLMTVI